MAVRLTTYFDSITYSFENHTSLEGCIAFWFPSGAQNAVAEEIDAVRYPRFSLTFFPRLGTPTVWPHITSEFFTERHIPGYIQLRLASTSYSIEVVPTHLVQPLRLDGRFAYPGGPSQAFFVPLGSQPRRTSPVQIGQPSMRPSTVVPRPDHGGSISGAVAGSRTVHQGSILNEQAKEDDK
ncbi:hypothetical protein F5883DRAFT_662791 [Diaporthe sp. PMI_573]|nr:hypothetical protein F5883DRAFT_662791 [Diaporthaceae sp. PMI_573]